MLAALALLACAWFGLGIRQSHEEARADALVHAAGTPTGAQTATILRLLDSASTLNPDRNIDLLRSEAEVRAGQAAKPSSIPWLVNSPPFTQTLE